MEKVEIFKEAFRLLRFSGIAKSQREYAKLLDVNEATVSKALKGEEGYLSDIMMSKVNALLIEKLGEVPNWESMQSAKCTDTKETLPIIPTEAMAGTLGEFADSVHVYDCERMISPIKGVDYAIKVCGDSMTPEIPNGSHILIKKVHEEQFVEWGKIYCLDTWNGAVIKKVYPTESPEVIECRSINPEFPPFQVNVKHINGWYRVLMVLSLK